ncbi:hypothetical protein GN156_08450 [bacterium LRH843]|nr:hypothetical protein [bacterium LRH843]
MEKRFHCCATCKHFLAKKKEGGGMEYRCIRLGYETKPSYVFSCWDPTEKVKRIMNKEKD